MMLVIIFLSPIIAKHLTGVFLSNSKIIAQNSCQIPMEHAYEGFSSVLGTWAVDTIIIILSPGEGGAPVCPQDAVLLSPQQPCG